MPSALPLAVAAAGSFALTGELEVTGTLSPDVTGTYDETGVYNGEAYYKLTGEGWYIWWDGANWFISEGTGFKLNEHWRSTDPGVTGDYEPLEFATGTATVGDPATVGIPSYYYAQEQAAA